MSETHASHEMVLRYPKCYILSYSDHHPIQEVK